MNQHVGCRSAWSLDCVTLAGCLAVADYDGPNSSSSQRVPIETSPREKKTTVTRCFALPADFLRVAQDVFCEEDLRGGRLVEG